MIAFHGFQHVEENVQVVTEEGGGWPGWTTEWADGLRERRGIVDHHLHNPFGLHRIRDRAMHVDQFELSCRLGLDWLANPSSFAAAVADVHAASGTVAAYVGSPLVVLASLAAWDLPTCSPGAKELTRRLARQRAMHLCDGIPGFNCVCWSPLVRFYLAALVDAKVDRIGFDFSADFRPGDCMDKLVRSLVEAGLEVMIEPWPRNDRPYPPVSWIVREQFYQRVRLEPRCDEVLAQCVAGKVYRIVPNHHNVEEGKAEIERINTLRERHCERRLETTQDFIDEVAADGHIPLVRARQLLEGLLV